MDPARMFHLAITLEEDLSAFYEELQGLEHLRPQVAAFQYMAVHSAEHAVAIAQTAAAVSLPEFNTAPLEELQRRIKTSLRDKMAAETDGEAVRGMLAQAENIAGQIYHAFAGHLTRTAEAYRQAAHTFERLSQEEYEHEAHLRRDDGA
jgi:hypothetical protein